MWKIWINRDRWTADGIRTEIWRERIFPAKTDTLHIFNRMTNLNLDIHFMEYLCGDIS